MKKIIVFLCLLTTLYACDNNENEDILINEQNYLIFGHFYGFCIGEECVETFKLTENQLFEDNIDDYTGEKLNFVALENEKFLLVKDIIEEFPAQLLDEDNFILGCPDCADGGGIIIQYSENGNLKKWRIDTTKSNIPEYLHNFIDTIAQKIALINN